jgi:hypothetical protein
VWVRQVKTLFYFSNVIVNNAAIFIWQGGIRDYREEFFTGRRKDASLFLQYHHGEPAFLHRPVVDMIHPWDLIECDQ